MRYCSKQVLILNVTQMGNLAQTVLPSDIAAWARSLTVVGYGRIINLTLTRWSGVLAAAIGALRQMNNSEPYEFPEVNLQRMDG